MVRRDSSPEESAVLCLDKPAKKWYAKDVYKKIFLVLLINIFLTTVLAFPAQADGSQKLGIHILNTTELALAKKLITVDQPDQWQYVTIPFTLDDLGRLDEWQDFFNQAKDQKVIPIVRLATRFENGSWQIPTRKDSVALISALSGMEWPTPERRIIVFNEVNHAKEWGGKIDPVGYANMLAFVSDWARSENKNYLVLPAAMDLAALSGPSTVEAFAYLDAMYQSDPEVFAAVDGWNSHSYPNPGFSASPRRAGKNSLQGFKYELAWIKQKTEKDFQVYITETGWEDNRSTGTRLADYYTYALENIWSDPQVVAVTPFVLKGTPGPFADFSFLTAQDQPTRQYLALRSAIQKVSNKLRLLSDASRDRAPRF
ncbi:MAG: hypothetical protein COY81_00655 [Candidatus Pacebacteria bacterium CG_4_10_14_0_8_um_filter_43_12]|nr:MAG: hypothetical protein COY81_00655 [Candidatus Pacebacteria bacterium CG_4_10_14_0_8_um_filter_43_12]